MSRQLIQKIKAMLLCIEYGIWFVDTVDMKIKAINAFNAMFVNTVDTGVCGSYTTPYGLSPLPGGKATVLCEPSILGV